MAKVKTQTVQIRLDRETLRKLDVLLAQRDDSDPRPTRSSVIRELIRFADV
jgi:metal-responsive CopG/Arc/MetJ family transcriptional regulator